jgi:hypothetical protein
MLARVRLRAVTLALAATYLLGLYLDLALLPWAGSLTLAALTAYAWLSAPERSGTLVPGLFALTGTAVLVDLRAPVPGWPLSMAYGAPNTAWAVAEGALTLCAAGALAAAVLTTAGRPRSRWAWVAVSGVGVVVAALAVLPLADLIDRPSWLAPANPWHVAVLVAPMICVTVLAALAAAAAAAARLRAGAGLAVLAAVALVGVAERVADARFYRMEPDHDVFLSPGLLLPADGARLDAGLAFDHGFAAERPAVAVLTGTRGAGLDGDAPRLWPPEVWTLGSSWSHALPAIMAALCLIGITAAVAAVPPGRRRDDPLA